MDQVKIIGIRGYAGAGKDTLALFLQYQIYCSNWDSGLLDNPLYRKGAKLDFTAYKKVLKLRSDGRSDGNGVFRFADTLKNYVCIATGCTREQLEDREFKESTLPEEWISVAWYGEDSSPVETYRDLMIAIGDKMREINENFFVNSTMTKVEKQEYHYTIMIPDLRFYNEVQAIRNRNGLIFHITNGKESTSNHPSERQMDNYKEYDAVIDNSGTLEDLMNIAGKLVAQFKLT